MMQRRQLAADMPFELSSDDNEDADNRLLRGLIKQARTKTKEKKKFDGYLKKKVGLWEQE